MGLENHGKALECYSSSLGKRLERFVQEMTGSDVHFV